MTAIVQHCISCYCIFSILIFHLHWNNVQTDHHRSCFPCHASTLQIIVETSKVAFQISFSIHCLIPICLGFLFWCISMQRSWMIPVTASFENAGSVTIRVSSLKNWIKSAISRSLLPLLQIVNSVRDHLSLTFPDSLDNSMQIMSDVFSTFKLCKWSMFSYLTKKFWNLLLAPASPALIWGHWFISLWYDAAKQLLTEIFQ